MIRAGSLVPGAGHELFQRDPRVSYWGTECVVTLPRARERSAGRVLPGHCEKSACRASWPRPQERLLSGAASESSPGLLRVRHPSRASAGRAVSGG